LIEALIAAYNGNYAKIVALFERIAEKV